MIPGQVHEFPGGSNAEEKIFRRFQESSVPGTVIHSFNLSSHRFKQWAEIDFLCILPFGLLALEVKGGRISRHDGKWFTNNNPLTESPFVQVKNAVYDLTKKLIPKQMVGVNFGWGVLLPDSKRIPATPENPDEMLADFEICSSQPKFDRWLDALVEFWASKKQKPALDKRKMGELVRSLRPNFDVPLPLGEHAKRVNDRILKFSQEQFERLDEIGENDRIICRGGAGTGKTFLALETVRRESAQQKKVLLTARNPRLVDWMQSGLPLEHVSVVSADDILNSDLGTDSVDVLVVDEGQDLLKMNYMAAMDRVLRGGFSAGRWRWFMDDQNQADLHSDTDEILCAEFLKPAATLKKLTRNCRNTKDIVEFTQFTTGADIGETELVGGGESPQFQFVDLEDESRAIADQIDLWRKQDIGWDRMVVLSCDVTRIPHIKRVVGQRVKVESVLDYKGLESDLVALAGIPVVPNALKEFRPHIYTGMTRAKLHLWVAVPHILEREWHQIRRENIEKWHEINHGGGES